MSRGRMILMAAATLAALTPTLQGIVDSPPCAPVAAGTPKGSRLSSQGGNRQRCGWLTHGQNPKRRPLSERLQRRRARRQRGKR